MATSGSSKDTRNFQCVILACFRVIKLPLIDILASQIQRQDLFQKIQSCSTLKLRPDQLKICFIPPPGVPDYNTFDVSLLYTLIRNLCSLRCPAQGWGKEPRATDIQISDDIERLRLIRNNYFHTESTVISDAVFENIWKDLKLVFNRIQQKTVCSVNYEEQLKKIELSQIIDELFPIYWVLLEAYVKFEKQEGSRDEPVIFIQGENEITCGGTAQFEADVKNVKPTCWSITWQKRNGNVITCIDTDLDKEKYNGSTKKKLVIQSVCKKDEGEYQAVLSFESNGPEYKSKNTIRLHAIEDSGIAGRLLEDPMVTLFNHSGSSFNSGSSGAFQPKKEASNLLHLIQMIPGLREPDKVPPSAASLPHHKESGKWCSMHVQIAWKIHRHQQESPDVANGGEGKSLDLLQSGLDRRKEERERERRSRDREWRGSEYLDQSQDRPFTGWDLRHPHTVSHSRSRSPLVGDRVGSAKFDTSYK